jgi:hypothetical protein
MRIRFAQPLWFSLALGLAAGCTTVDSTAHEARGVDAGPSGDGHERADARCDGGTVVDGGVIDGQPAPASRVIPLYLAGADEPAAAIAQRTEVYTRTLLIIQAWYAAAMGASYHHATFGLEPVLVLRSHYTMAEWSDFQVSGFPDPDSGTVSGFCNGWFAAVFDLSHGVLEAAGLAGLFTPGVNYLVIAPAGGCGAGGLSVVEEPILERIDAHCPEGHYGPSTSACDGATDPWCAPWPLYEAGYACAAVGALTHEIGHSFGLPHCGERPTCSGPSVMDLWWDFERGVTLSAEDRQDLSTSPYFASP